MAIPKISHKAAAILTLLPLMGAALSFAFGYALIAVVCAGAAVVCVGFVAFAGQRSEDLETLFSKKRALVESLGAAEKRFLSRELDDAAYRQLVDQKQRLLVEIEAKIDLQSGLQNPDHAEELQKITSKNRHRLKQLLDQKTGMVEEAHFAEQKYLHREMDEEAFFALRGKQQADLLELDGQINSIESVEAAAQVLDELRVRLAELEQTQAQKRKRKEEEMSEDLFEQQPRDGS